jgi:hypothetical protein
MARKFAFLVQFVPLVALPLLFLLDVPIWSGTGYAAIAARDR